jgi:hypothetical protein
MRLVKTLSQNLGQILPESFYRILGFFTIHYVQPKELPSRARFRNNLKLTVKDPRKSKIQARGTGFHLCISNTGCFVTV